MAKSTIASPELETGLRMSQEEFHRRYELRPDLKRAQLIEGVVYLASPMRFDVHDEQATLMSTWLSNYAYAHPGIVKSGSSATIILDAQNEYQPDAFLFFTDPASNPPVLDDKHYLHGAPHLVVEVGASSLPRDLGEKFRVYQRSGAREYIVWRVDERQIDWYELRDGAFALRPPNSEGIIESGQFDGLRLDVAAAIALDGARVLAALR